MVPRAAMIMPVYVPTFILSFAQGMLIPILPIFAKGFGVSFSLASPTLMPSVREATADQFLTDPPLAGTAASRSQGTWRVAGSGIPSRT